MVLNDQFISIMVQTLNYRLKWIKEGVGGRLCIKGFTRDSQSLKKTRERSKVLFSSKLFQLFTSTESDSNES